MPHRQRVQSEFTRQAESFAASPTLNAPEVTETIAAALGEARRGRVLDLACGPGIVAAALGAEARRVVAFDLTGRTLEVARERCKASGRDIYSFTRGLAEQLPFASGCFDGIALRLAIHHFEDPALVLREAARVCRPGGTLAVLDLLSVADPDEAALHNALERLRDPSHVRMLAEEELRREIEAAGFEVTEAGSRTRARDYDEWAAIIADPVRMESLRVVMQHLARRGANAGIELAEREGAIQFSYRWALFAARRV